MRLSGRTLGGLLALCTTLAACHTTCKNACDILLECDEVESSRVNPSECEVSCSREMALYDQWENQALLDALQDELDCIGDLSCEEIAAGACYDEQLYLYKDSGLE